MKFIIDNKIPYIKGALEPFGEVHYLAGKETTAEIVKNADAIVTRTRTICNEQLLKNSKVQMIASATIGFDHIDTTFCEQNNIEWTNAPGCNAGSVQQYVASALCWFSQQKKVKLKGKTIGIVGVGNVGKKVQKIAELFEMNVLLNDPPRAREEGEDAFVDLETIQREADVITFHTPMTRTGDDATFHLGNASFFNELTQCPLIINSSRGEVLETKALQNALATNQINGAIIDCWENEPEIDSELLHSVDLASPHIAGYSRDGKANGTQMSIQAISQYFNLGIDNWAPNNIEQPENPTLHIQTENKNDEEILQEIIVKTYAIFDDHKRLIDSPSSFEKQRGDYPVRREYKAYKVEANGLSAKLQSKIKELGFTII